MAEQYFEGAARQSSDQPADLFGDKVAGQSGDKTHEPEQLEFFVTCGRGLESCVADELRALGVNKVRPLASGVAFFGRIEQALRACLWLRTASRVLLIVDRVPAADSDTLYENIKAIPWEKHIAADASFAIDARGSNEKLRNSQFVGQRVKDAVADRIRDVCGRRPDIKLIRPDVQIYINLRGEKATVAIDMAGEPLHRRGYRVASSNIVASLRETLAAALLIHGGWDVASQAFCCWESKPQAPDREVAATQAPDSEVAVTQAPDREVAATQAPDSENATPQAPGFLLDPLCGSGTIAIEAALMAADRAPGLLRDYWGFSGWLGFDAEIWHDLLVEADERVERKLAGLANQPIPILASDIDAAALQVAFESAKKAGVEKLIDFDLVDIADYRLPVGYTKIKGLLATNPPYGQRMASSAQLPALYATLAGLISKHQSGFDVVIISPDNLSEDYLNPVQKSNPTKQTATMNGPLAVSIRAWQIQKKDTQEKDAAGLSRSKRDRPIGMGGPNDFDQSGIEANEAARAFANRLAKMARHRSKWARRSGVYCYRLYDADLPDFNVAIDIYTGAAGTADEGKQWLHIAEYKPPASINPDQANARLAEVLRIAPEVLAVSPSEVFLKRRERSKGGSQYGRNATSATTAGIHLIEEGGLRFEVDLASRLDTGIFLDHRITRDLLRGKAAGCDCLNLFAYTGSASVYMADGGAKSVTTVDLSRPYLDWAVRNMELNGFVDQSDRSFNYVQADALRWIREVRSAGWQQSFGQGQTPLRFGLIFVDVPTFSNSSRMGQRNWDVQRDHVELLITISRLLTSGGEAVFSTNLKSFRPDVQALAKARVAIKDISDLTIPADFERSKKIHQCYIVTREK
ncbi:MAG: bifunctional 23S rRNA (guanine(2069)-N(7))-methyltransferase RlmK/23S rRNA (guanine(2445)-N(2))-methyltransferase RlmL [Coriobacteriales bacterium]|nr:bifunctional 23S rRNA (guanine(2069)-N(7))-methyltransferase RlmK/23S rRNA (guanine(2445)-N(2))-methyltransferase RlmL [Coriobacteriales bacterium]